ncbi:prefoldin subunit 4 isoform X1 [Lagenorhynchus albirostris]|uniref:prefoldin subunit 4 isoform X1 n=1 Tax=Lagenorhynchus albirostris TaxID=27610 RepID=UPI0028C48E1F|nr:prefoldin subunit 4 isoform X1 [Delphinus delphis]XP_059979052.1 prefoldin subunit 4 isoform X1 [Lagenorhynchus albirostris]XP_060140657.1 prefoldin subunit 4 isoform X1 [Globicephala melas]
MAATMKKAAAEDVNVTFEDQQKINKFARNTSRITELKEEIEVKKKQLQNLEDACEDIMLADDDCLMIPYQIGDVFISHSQEETQEMLEEAKAPDMQASRPWLTGPAAPWHVGSSRTGHEPVSPASAGGLSTTAPPGKPSARF